MQCVVQCMIVHEWNVRAFFDFFFSSFFVLTNAKCKCHRQMSWLVLPMHYVLYAINKLWNTDPNVNFSMNANKMWCKSRFLVLIQMLLDKDAKKKFVMQMPYAGMQSLFMMMPVHTFKSWCKCLLTEMEMQMSSNRYVMMLMPLCKNAMMQMLWRKHNLFKNSLCFQIEASSVPETKISSKLDLLFLKSHLLFFYSAYLFQIKRHISDAVRRAMYDCAWMKCLSI